MDRGIKRLLVALILGLGISTGMVLTMNALPGRTQAHRQAC